MPCHADGALVVEQDERDEYDEVEKQSDGGSGVHVFFRKRVRCLVRGLFVYFSLAVYSAKGVLSKCRRSPGDGTDDGWRDQCGYIR